jgi:hypothetical protein
MEPKKLQGLRVVAAGDVDVVSACLEQRNERPEERHLR